MVSVPKLEKMFKIMKIRNLFYFGLIYLQQI